MILQYFPSHYLGESLLNIPRNCLRLIAISIITIPLISLSDELPGTSALTWDGDIASRLIDKTDQFLLEKIDQAVKKRHASSQLPNKEKLKKIIGARDQRPKKPKLYLSEVQKTEPSYTIQLFKLQAFGGVHVEGFLLQPKQHTEPHTL